MPPAHLAELEQDPQMLEGFLGREPEIEGGNALAFEFFWRCRRATPGDQPLDPTRALALYERLYGECDAFDLLDKLQAMDGAFSRHVAGEIEAKREKPKAKKGR